MLIPYLESYIDNIPTVQFWNVSILRLYPTYLYGNIQVFRNESYPYFFHVYLFHICYPNDRNPKAYHPNIRHNKTDRRGLLLLQSSMYRLREECHNCEFRHLLRIFYLRQDLLYYLTALYI